MNSPVHSFLLSPPTSPPSQIGSGDIDPLSSLKDLLLLTAPSPSQRYIRDYKVSSPLVPVQIIPTAQAGPGGFNSTSAYPSRYSSGMRRPSGAERRTSPPPSLPAFMPSDADQTTEIHQKTIKKTELYRRRSSAKPNAKSVFPTFSLARMRSFLTRRRGYRYALLIIGIVIGLCFFCKKSERSTPYSRASYQARGALSPEEIRERLVEMAEGRALFGTTSRVTGGKKVHVVPPGDEGSAENEGDVGPASPVRTTRTTDIQQISPERELLALQAYLLESTSNGIVATVDPNVPLDPSMMVSFDPKNEQGWNELKSETVPVVIWDVGLAQTKEVHEILKHYAILPVPRTFKLKDRADAHEIQSIFSRLIPGRPFDLQRPLITIGGAPVDGSEALTRHHEDGTLAEMLTEAGAVVDGQKEAERAESERRRRGRPIRMGKVERVART